MPRQSRHVGGLDGVEEVDQEFAPNSRQISSKKFLDIRFYSKSVSMIYNIRFVLILQKLIIRAVFLLENIFQSSALPENWKIGLWILLIKIKSWVKPLSSSQLAWSWTPELFCFAAGLKRSCRFHNMTSSLQYILSNGVINGTNWDYSKVNTVQVPKICTIHDSAQSLLPGSMILILTHFKKN